MHFIEVILIWCAVYRAKINNFTCKKQLGKQSGRCGGESVWKTLHI